MPGAMSKFKENYVVDKQGNPIGVVLDIADYRKLLEELEELESIRAYDTAKADGGEIIPFEQAVSEIERVCCDTRGECPSSTEVKK
jgi:hypothetical protein